MTKFIVIFVLSLTLGTLLPVRWNSRSASDGIAPKSSPAGKIAPHRWTQADLQSMMHSAGKRGDASGQNIHPLSLEIEKLSDSELRHALDEAVGKPDCALSDGPVRQLARRLVVEWMKRDLQSFLTWFEGMKSDTTRNMLSSQVAESWPPDRSEEGLVYAAKHPGFFSDYGFGATGGIVHGALEASAKRGAAAVEECLAAIRASGLPLPGGILEFPSDFDFAALARGPEIAQLWQGGKAAAFMDEWMKRNPEGAFQGILANSANAGTNPATYLFSYDLPVNPSDVDARMEWLADKMNSFDESARQSVIEQGSKALTFRPDALASFASSLSDPSDQARVHEYAFDSVYTIGMASALQHLEALGDPATRIAYLEEISPLPSRDFNASGLTEQEEQRLHDKLMEWQAQPAEVQAILARFKRKPNE